jgi:hypothetical protein
MNMSTLCAICVSICILASCSTEEAPETRESAAVPQEVIPDSVRQELARLGAEDQAIRQGLTPERMQDTAFAMEMLQGDSARTIRLRAIIEAYGWPDSARAGPQASQAAFLILQHSPVHAFQRDMLPIIEDLAQGGAIARDEAAMLVDRVLVAEGRPQRYGTQFSLIDGRLVLDSVADPGRLDERRRSMGLPTMDEYMKALAEVYDAEVAR